MSRRQRRTRAKRRRHAATPGQRLRSATLSGGLAAAATLGLASSAEAATFTVNNAFDPGDGSCVQPAGCTLREALQAAQDNDNSPTVDNITFGPLASGTIYLGAGRLPQIDEPLNVVGPGADVLTVDGQDFSGIFYVNPYIGDPVTISGLHLENGYRPGLGGGAIQHQDADLTVSGSYMSGNIAQFGGAISSIFAPGLTVEDSTLADNFAYDGTDPAEAKGGGIFALETDLTVRNSTIHSNGAISFAAGSPVVRGGGIFIESSAASATLESSTVSQNEVLVGALPATGRGGGISEYVLESNPVLHNTIVAGNTAPSSGPELDGIFDGAFALVQNTSGAGLNETIAGSNITGQPPELQALGDNGGPTPTQALAPTSPAIDAGRSFCAATDQRGSGFGRPSDLLHTANSAASGADGADIGAYEFQGGTVSTPPLCATPSAPAVGGGGGATPPNAFELGKLVKNKKKGIAFLFVNLPGPGEVGLSGKGIKNIGLAASAAARKSLAVAGGRVKLKIKPGKGKKARKVVRQLKDKGKAKLKVRVTYVPTGGIANTQGRKLKLVRK